MSRWDALRPERQECAAKKSIRPRLSSRTLVRPSDGSLDWHRQLTKLNEALKEGNTQNIYIFIDKLNAILDLKADIPPKLAGDAVLLLSARDYHVAATKRMELACRILAERSILLENKQVTECVENFTASNDPRRIECLARLVLVASRQMPAEEAANELVANTLLPALENPSHNNASVVIDAIQCLVSDSLHASALLAPLTFDISATGKEETVTNPLRRRLMRTLQSLLGNKLYSHRACSCLVKVIKATTTPGDSNEIDALLLIPFFVDATREKNQTRQGTAFELLRLVLKTYPTTGTSLSTLFIGDQRLPVTSGKRSCSHCLHQQNMSPLLDLLHDANDDRMDNIVPCIQELLQVMPLRLWIGTSLSGFGKRTSEALIRLMQIVQCRFQQHPSSIPSLCPAMQVILNRIPYSDNENDEMTCQAMRLLSMVAADFMRRRRCEPVVECFVNCMGGQPQPQGGCTVMSVPMRLWLGSKLSQDFREYLWSSLELARDFRDALQILCAVVRSSPAFVWGDQATWERCQRVIIAHTSDVSFHIRLGGLTLLEHLLAGRMEKGGPETVGDSSIALFATSIAFDMLKDPTPHLRTMSLNCFEAFLTEDWLVLSSLPDDTKCPSFQDHVEAILFHCTKPNEPNAGARAVACKCVGSICTQYLSDSTKDKGCATVSDEFCGAVCETLSTALQDSNGVRVMAVFAIGNLAHALREYESREPLLPSIYIKPLCEMVNSCFNESNGKLVNNAVRTIGHLVSLAFNPPYIDSGVLDDWDCHSFYRSVLRGLDGKVEAVLALDAFHGSSWKQRSSINKHGWGACNSLALVLDCNEASVPGNLNISQHSLVLLVQCIAKAELVHEKVASAATAAIRRISGNILARISDETGIVGMALSPSLLQLYQMKKLRRQRKARLASELELLLEHLLRATSISDACYLLKQEDVEKKALEFLYDWMIDANMPIRSFEAFALALQRRDLMDDAGLQQKFASRALQMYRDTNNGDDTDEL